LGIPGHLLLWPTNTVSCPNFNVTYWVAPAARTSSMNIPANTSGSYRVYVEIGNNIYVGELVHAGASLFQNISSHAAPQG